MLPAPRIPALALAGALLATGAVAAPLPDGVLAQLMVQTSSAATRFERTIRASNGGDDVTVLIDRLEDGQPPRLISIDGRPPTPREVENYAKRRDSPPLFHRLHLLLAQPPRHRSEAGGRTVYQWHGLPKTMVVTPGGDISHRLTAELLVDQRGARPEVKQLRIYAAAPFSVRIVAEVKQFNMIGRYTSGPDGQTFLSALTVESDVSAPMGLGGQRHSTVTFRPL